MNFSIYLLRYLRAGSMILIVSTLIAGFIWPDLFALYRRLFLWLIPVWISALFFAQALATPNSDGSVPILNLWNRLLRKKWTCGRCGSVYPLDVPLCGACGQLRESSRSGPWICRVCNTGNAPEATHCASCTVPRPSAQHTA